MDIIIEPFQPLQLAVIKIDGALHKLVSVRLIKASRLQSVRLRPPLLQPDGLATQVSDLRLEQRNRLVHMIPILQVVGLGQHPSCGHQQHLVRH